MTSGGDVDVLKRLSAKVVIQYEDLLQKYEENEKKYEDLVTKYQEKEKQLQEMQKLIQPAVSEYEQIKMKYDMEVDMRTEAEKYASKIVKENKNLKRQSSMLLSKIPQTLDLSTLKLDELDAGETDKDTSEDYTKKLNETIRELESEVATLRCSLKQSEEDLTIEKERSERLHHEYTVTCTKLHMTEQSLTQYKEAIEELSKVSETAYTEFEMLQVKYELAKKRNSDVQDEMSKIKIQNEAIKKQSTILMSNAATNMQLVMALNEVETLTTQLKEEKQKYDREIDDLKQQLAECSGTAAIEEMNNENSRLKDEKNNLNEKISQFEEQYKELEAQYKELENKYQDVTRPPPPPPPPPPPSIQKSKGFLTNIKIKTKTEEVAAKQLAPQGYSKALEEMMSRIQKGETFLKLKNTPAMRREENKESTINDLPSDSGPQKSSAMEELNGILGKFKRNMSVSDINTSSKQNSESELDKIFKRRNINQENGSNKIPPAVLPKSTTPSNKLPGAGPLVSPKPLKQPGLNSSKMTPKLDNTKHLSVVQEERGSQLIQQNSAEQTDEVLNSSSA